MDVREAMEKAATDLGSDVGGAEEPAAPVETAAAPAVEAAPAPAPEKPAADRARDETGKFAKQDKPPEKPAEGAAKAKATVPPAPPPPVAQGKPETVAVHSPTAPVSGPPAAPPVKPPQSWKPAEREAFGKAPPEVQAAVTRREHEITSTLNETAQARQVAAQTYQALQPYEGIARAAGMDAWSWAGQALQERAQLQMGPVAQRAPILARMLAEGGQELVDQVSALLEGKAAAPQAPQQPAMDPRAIFREELGALQRQAQESKAKAEAQEFLATQPEYVNDVVPQMKAIYAAAQADGRNVTMKEAYDEACWMNPAVREAIQKAKAAEAVRAPQPVTEQQRRAASSVRTQPAAAPAAQSKGIRGAIEAAAEKVGM